ncbi:porin family protein [uncultured Cytophaga sp.]|uniref:type IX secretion system protein SprT n=1 Tax=uncultured Cytophaga sp. TaxID=160238 RepID=UPI0026203196|nr:porin family protein [uncultured Cytophaga sp.]
MKSLSILFLSLFILAKVQAQDPRWTNLPFYDDKFMHYGFTLGVNASGFQSRVSPNYFNDTVRSAAGTYTPGFSLGFIVNFRLHDHFDLRVLPTVGFYSRNIKYDFYNSSEIQTIESTFMEIPLMLKYKSMRRNNSRMYVIGGLKAAIEAGAKKKQRKITDLRTDGFDLCLDLGVGMDLYCPLFKFSPEIRFSHGLLNLLSHDPNIYSSSLSRLSSNTISLFLNFE